MKVFGKLVLSNPPSGQEVVIDETVDPSVALICALQIVPLTGSGRLEVMVDKLVLALTAEGATGWLRIGLRRRGGVDCRLSLEEAVKACAALVRAFYLSEMEE